MFNATVIERLDEQRVRANVEGRECNICVNFAVEPGQKNCMFCCARKTYVLKRLTATTTPKG
ncbi:hypothetical protein MJK70_10330 [Klebsiella pneumoniae]|nr:hypothetical protein MJK70_10330 [Klebsiella pneumoniae]